MSRAKPTNPHHLLRVSTWVSVCAVLTIGVSANILAAHTNHRFDITSDHRYSLSTVTRNTLSSLPAPVVVNVLLSKDDPLTTTTREVLQAYVSSSPKVSVRWFDPDKDPGRFTLAQSELGVLPGDTRDQSIIVLVSGARKGYIAPDDVVELESDSSEGQPRVEQALTRGLQQMFVVEHPRVCFSSGHKDMSLDDQGPDGLSELDRQLTRAGYQAESLDLAVPRQSKLSECALLVVAAPDVPLSPWAVQQVLEYQKSANPIWILASTTPDETGRVQGTGLNALTNAVGITIANEIAVETDSQYRLSDGFGETFFAEPLVHEITRALRPEMPDRASRVLVSMAPIIRLSDSRQAQILLQSSDAAASVSDVGEFLRTNGEKRNSGKHAIAAAASMVSPAAGKLQRLVITPASLAANRTLKLASLQGNRLLVESIPNWLMLKQCPITIERSHRTAYQLLLSDGDFARLKLYVLAVIPCAVLFLGLAIVLGRKGWALGHRGKS